MTKPYFIILFLVAMILPIMAQETWPIEKSLLQSKLDSLADKQPNLLHICTFFDRYTHELKKLSSIERQSKLKIDQVRIESGNLENLALVSSNTHIFIGSAGKRHMVAITDNSLTLLSLSFPRSYELLVGMNKIELENNFSSEVKRCVSKPAEIDSVPLLTVDKEQGYWVRKGTSFLVKTLSSDLYYQQTNTGYRLIFEPEYPLESVSNLLLSTSCPGDYTIELSIRKYGFKTESFRIPLKQWVNYCNQSGCTSYIGIENSDGDKITVTVFAVNDLLQYAHVFNATISSDQIAKSSGTLQANIHIYIPTYNISELFDKYKESNNKKIPIYTK